MSLVPTFGLMEDSMATATPSASSGANMSTPGLPLILDGNFFKVIAEDGLKVTGQCTLCPSRIMGLKTTTSNFNTHLKKMHPERHRIYEEYKVERGQQIKKRRTSHDGRGSVNPGLRRQVINESPGQPSGSNGAEHSAEDTGKEDDSEGHPASAEGLAQRRPAPSPSHSHGGVRDTAFRPLLRRVNAQTKGSVSAASLPPTIKARRKETDDIVFNFVIKSLSPPALVESPYFTSLVSGLCSNPRRVMSRSTLESRINMQSMIKRTKLVRSLASVDLICVTLDAWTVTQEPINTFIALTAHWICPTLQVSSALLTCLRLQEDLTYRKLVQIISDVLEGYYIPTEKIGCLVTSNASSLLPTRIYALEGAGEAEGGARGPTTEDLSFYNISSILSEAPPDFPSHYDCPTVTLLGVLATATFEVLGNPDRPTSYIFSSAMGKCQGLWSAVGNKEAGERIAEMYGLEILIPNRLNWGSFLEAIDCLLGGRDVLEGIFNFFDLAGLDENEVEFLEEYVKVMEPVTEALNLLQDVSRDSYMGSFVPTILSVKDKLENLKDLKYTEPLVDSLLGGLDGPFLDIITLDSRARPLILASILHPSFKLSWIPKDKVEELKGWYLEEASNFGHVVESNSNLKARQTSNGKKEGEGVEREGSREDASSVLIEFLDYLDAPTDPVTAGQLDLFPNVKKLFVTFNTAIAASVHVEKVLSFPEVSYAPSSALLPNEMLEKMLILKCN